MSETRPIGGMVEQAMGPGGSGLAPEEEALVEIEGQAPGITDELIGDMVLTMNEDGSAEFSEADPTAVLAEEYSHTANLAEILDDSVLGTLSSELVGLVEDDIESRSEWEDALAKGLNLLGISYEERDEPFSGASGVTHPLIAESVTQFQSQAYKEMLPPNGPVRTSIVGVETPEVMAQAKRVKDFMNYQLSEVMEEYDQDMDQMLFYLPLSGSTFKKVYFDPARQRAISKFVPAEDVVVPYSSSDIRTAERITHICYMSENDIIKMQMATIYRDVDLKPYDDEGGALKEAKSDIQGVRPSYQDDMYTLYEIQTYLDLEGFEDTDLDGNPTGLKLPYLVTIDKASGQVLSIVRNWDEEDPGRKPLQYFVHYKFLPGLGFYGFGLVHMIGGLSRAATSILRQLIDAGTLANLPAGFKARGVRIRNDDEPLQPGEFRDIDVPGGDIRNAIVPMVYKEPSGTLSQLLGVLVDSGRRYASIADANIQDVNQQMPVGTTVALLERGSRVMSAIHKRMHKAQKQEFRLLAGIFADTVEGYPYQLAGDIPAEIFQQDFDGRVDVLPVSDPNIFSMAQRMSLAQTQLQMAQANPEIHDVREAYRRMYEALEIKNVDALLPLPPEPQPLDPAGELAAVMTGAQIVAAPGQNHMAHIQSHLAVLQSPKMMEAPAISAPLMTNIFERLSLIAQEEMQRELAQQQQAMMMQGIQPPQVDPQQLMPMIEQRTAELVAQVMPQLTPQDGDPLVDIRQTELQIQAADQERKARKDQIDAMLEQARIDQQGTLARERLQATLDIAGERNNVNRERIETQEDIAVFKEMNRRRQ